VLHRLRQVRDSAELVQHDLMQPVPPRLGTFHAVIADPPWYTEHYKAFLVRAADILHDGGLLLLSVLPWLTRPSAIDDRRDILKYARILDSISVTDGRAA